MEHKADFRTIAPIWSHGFYTSDFRARSDISHTDRPSLLSPDSADHRALQLHVRGRGGRVPAHWGLERQLSSLEKGFSVEDELAVLKLPCGWHVGHQGSSVLHPATLGPSWGGQEFTAHTGAKGSHFPHSASQTPFVYGTAIAPTSSVSNLSCLHSSPAVQACLLPGTGAKSEYGIFPAGLRDCLLPRQLWSGREYYQTTDLEKEGQATLSA